MADRFNIEVFIQNIKNINTILKQNLYIIENMKELMNYSNVDTASIDEIKKDIASLEKSVNKLTLLNYIDFPTGGLVNTSYDTNEYQIKAPFEMKTSETGEVINSGNFNFKLLIGGSDFITVDLDETDSFLQIRLDQTKVDSIPLLNSKNLVTSGGVAQTAPIILNLESRTPGSYNEIISGSFATASYERLFYSTIANAIQQKRPLIVLDNNGWNYMLGYSLGSNCSFLSTSDERPYASLVLYNIKEHKFVLSKEISTV